MVKLIQSIKSLFAPRDMSQGTPWKRIAEFAFPMLLGNFAQQLYNTVDAIVIGNSRWGDNGLAAVGNAGSVLNLLLALFVGIATGAGILVSQYYGARDRDSLSATIGNCISLAAISSLVIMIVGPMVTMPLLHATNTLPVMIDDSAAYLNIFFVGISGFFFYNIFAGVLRGLGDSLSALGFLLLTSALNVVLDILLVDKMGVAGVALATVISQVVSAALCLVKLLRMKHLFSINLHTLKLKAEFVKKITQLGLPSGVTQAIFSLAMMVVQRLINGFNDPMFVACNIMVMRVDGFAMLPNFSFGQAIGTFTGQNVGAKRIDRLEQGASQGLIMSFGTAVVLTPLVVLAGPWLMGLFTPNTSLVNMSMSMLYLLATGYVAMSVTQVFSGVMRGAGDTMTPMWISFATTVLMRVPLAYFLVWLAKTLGGSVLMQEKMVFLSLLITWLLGMLITSVLYLRGGWKKKQVNAILQELEDAGNKPQ